MIKYMFDFWTDSSITNLFELVQFKFVQSPNINVYIMVGIEVLCSNIKFCLKFGTNSNTLKQNKYFWTKLKLIKLKKWNCLNMWTNIPSNFFPCEDWVFTILSVLIYIHFCQNLVEGLINCLNVMRRYLWHRVCMATFIIV